MEKKKEIAACNFFKYPARKKKDGSEPSFEERRKHGAPKNRNWANKNFLPVLRANFAQIQNEVLERNGYSIRVDHRSLEAQKEEAESNGDTILARLFSRLPEKYIGVISCQENDEPRLERLKIFRGLRKQHFDMVMKIDALTKEADELEVKDVVQLSSTHAKELMESKEYAAQKFVSEYLAAMRNKMLTAVAKMEYMTKTERELWQKYFETLGQKKRLEEFLQTLRKPDETQKEELNAYNDIVDGVKAKIFSLFTASLAMKKSVDEIQHRLDSPEFRKNILLVTHQILQSNSYALKWLKKASDELEKAVDELRNALFVQTMEEPQTSFKPREVYDLIRRQYCALKKEHENLFVDKFQLQRQVISPQRAIFMAKNIFVHGDFKKLRAEMRRYKKKENRRNSYWHSSQKF